MFNMKGGMGILQCFAANTPNKSPFWMVKIPMTSPFIMVSHTICAPIPGGEDLEEVGHE